MVLRGDRLEPDKPAVKGPVADELAGARELYRREDYGKAEHLFHKIADNKKNPEAVAEEARFYEAECLYRQKRYPKAADVYNKVCADFPSGAHREQAVRRMFDIANYWLDDTREAMKLEREKKEGKRSFVLPASFVHLEKTKPLLDEEGRALEKLEQAYYNDIMGPVADEALFLAGSVKFYHQDFKEADFYFTQLVQMHPNSKFAPQAVELGIIAKNLSTGGPDYDGRKSAEARLMVYTAQDKYPELAVQKSEFLQRQLSAITQMQAEKDWRTAEFYRRTGHPGAAYFCYEIVRRRYPGTPYCEKATQKMQEVAEKVERSREKEAAKAAPAEQMWPAKPAAPNRPEVAPPPRRIQPNEPAPLEVAPPPRPVPPGGG